jgi:wobble nucleotide-excising tRNase
MINPPSLNIEREILLAKQIVGNNNSSVAEFITKLGSSDWIKDGLKYLPTEITSLSESCPFCQEKTISKELLANIKDYFDESYENDLNILKGHLTEWIDIINNFPDKSIYESNPKMDSYKKDFEIKYNEIVKIYSDNRKKIEDKIKSPSISVILENSNIICEGLTEIILKVNQLVREHNNKIDNKGKALIEIKNLFWEINRWEYDQTIEGLRLDKNTLNFDSSIVKNEITDLNNQIAVCKNIIVDQQRKTVNIEEAVANINGTLVELGIDEFKIIKHSEVLYKIARSNVDLKVFSSLSEGEKMIISFLYFLELCKGKKNADEAINKKIVVIDDPISSLSHIYVFNIGRLIHNEFFRTDKYEQIFILTHSLYFFYELTYPKPEKRKESQKLFRLRKNSSGSEILEMSYDEIQNDYQSYWNIVKDDKQPPALIANCMRNIIEYFYNFVEKNDLNNVFQKPEFQKNRYHAFNRYINRESHSLGQNIFDYKEFNYVDFKDAFALVFRVSGYEDHYNKMIK